MSMAMSITELKSTSSGGRQEGEKIKRRINFLSNGPTGSNCKGVYSLGSLFLGQLFPGTAGGGSWGNDPLLLLVTAEPLAVARPTITWFAASSLA